MVVESVVEPMTSWNLAIVKQQHIVLDTFFLLQITMQANVQG